VRETGGVWSGRGGSSSSGGGGGGSRNESRQGTWVCCLGLHASRADGGAGGILSSNGIASELLSSGAAVLL
jgi:hypothetical protein